jgi:SnoaL-like domain
VSRAKALGRDSTPNPSGGAAEANVETIRRFHDAMETGDRRALGELVREIAHPEAEWRPLVTEVEGDAYRGKDGVFAFFDDFLGSFEVRYEDRDLRAVDDRAVVMLCRMELKGRGSGAVVAQEMGVLYEFDGALLRRGRAYPSRADALTAAQELTSA